MMLRKSSNSQFLRLKAGGTVVVCKVIIFEGAKIV